MKVVAGDIGGTKTFLQIVEFNDDGYTVHFERLFSSAEHSGFADVLRDFIDTVPDKIKLGIEAACIAVAGPISSDKKSAKVTNLPWRVELSEIKAECHVSKARLINDFEAVGHGIAGLKPDDLLCLQEGTPSSHGHCAIIGAGTGLGMGQVFWNQEQRHIFPSEGGHADFSPNDDQQKELLAYLTKKHKHVSWEHVVSGPGLVNIYNFLRSTKTTKECKDIRQAMRGNVDKSAVISKFATDVQDPLSTQALELFVRTYASVAGNLALTTLPFGGLYIAGGIAPKISSFLTQKEFISSFRNKSKMSPLLDQIPVYLVQNSTVGIIGASIVASQLTEEIKPRNPVRSQNRGYIPA
ncbi:glucokinase [Pseudomonadota bacterium]